MKLWKTAGTDAPRVAALAGELKLPWPVAAALLGLPLRDTDTIARFLNPRLSDLTDPFLLPDMDAAVCRIWKALDDGEPIAVFGDYDADGITSTALLVRLLGRLGGTVRAWLPSRLQEGYGLSVEALRRCLSSFQPTLLITVDCGTTAVDAVELARDSGIDVIVTDHHELAEGRTPARALAVVNPKRGDNADLKNLAGVGVVFKLCHALLKRAREQHREKAIAIDLRDYLDWVALGTVADIASLLGENRILVRHGLARLNRAGTPGLEALIAVAGVRRPVEAGHVGFYLGPRLNAMGRLGDPGTALELLLTEHAGRARELAMQMDARNRERQDIESRIFDDALAMMESFFNPAVHFGLAIGRAGWHPGVIGIVASKLVSRYRRPTILIAFGEDGKGRGTCRSIEDYNILDGLNACSDLLLAYGGHEMAAGLEIESRNYEAFRNRFNDAVCRSLTGRDFRPVLRISAWVDFADLNPCLLDSLQALKPFGQDNPAPVWALRNVMPAAPPRRIKNKHLALTFGDAGRRWPAIAFGMADRDIPSGPLDIAFTLEQNAMSENALQLKILDFRAHE
ncbi:MAG: single-stranded-DNA-specific exonuclease RecJ [Lentisphaerae bacterium]|nr:single-stranded-DNA-specific exonuclease RecJ [Lentisphaerota bacterium]